MSRPVSLAGALLTAGLLLVACGYTEVQSAGSASECPGSGFEMAVTAHNRVGGTGFLTIGLSNCDQQRYVLDSHPAVDVIGADVTARRQGNQPEAITIGPGETLVAPVTWRLLADSAAGTIPVAQLVVNALPRPTGYVIDVDPTFELHIDQTLDVGTWQFAGSGPGPEPVETATPEPDDGECPEEGFRITVSGSNAAMGIRATGIEMVNCGDDAIEVDGYPMVEVLRDGAPVAVEVRHGSEQLNDPGPAHIVVAPGESVGAGMLWRHLVESANPDDIVTATELMMSYAEGAPAQIVQPEYAVDLGTTRYLEVTAWHRPAPGHD